MSGTFLTAAVFKEHKVRTGETLVSLAAKAGLSGKELTEFNWGTSDPKEINRFLRDVVGCTKKTADGKNYMFDSSDDPGIVLVPKRCEARGLAVNERHTIRVLRRRVLFIRLKDDAGHPIPDTSFKLLFSDDSSREGTLGRAGIAVIKDPPEGPFAVFFPDQADILAKSLAACCRDAVAAADVKEVCRFLQHPPDIIAAAIEAYSDYYDDYGGKGLLEDLYACVADDDALAAVEGLMAYAGLPTRETIGIAQRLDEGSE
jgi:hypothetical protein